MYLNTYSTSPTRAMIAGNPGDRFTTSSLRAYVTYALRDVTRDSAATTITYDIITTTYHGKRLDGRGGDKAHTYDTVVTENMIEIVHETIPNLGYTERVQQGRRRHLVNVPATTTGITPAHEAAHLEAVSAFTHSRYALSH